MTQEHISHPEGLSNCAAGHRARHIHDKRSASAGGGCLVECACRSTSNHADPDMAIAAWRRLNLPCGHPETHAQHGFPGLYHCLFERSAGTAYGTNRSAA